MTSKEKTYKQLAREYLAAQKAQKVAYQGYNEAQTRVSDLADAVANAAVKALPYEIGSLVQNDLGGVFRVTRISVPSLRYRDDIPELADVLADTRVYGILVDVKNGVERWKDGRQIMGELTPYRPE